MNIDRSLFLAFAASLSTVAAVGCSSSDDSTASDAPEVNAGGELCWAPTTESASGAGRDWWVRKIGFDPIADYPAAEGFCFDLAAGPSGGFDWDNEVELASQQGIYEKCQAYARSYVPYTTYQAFDSLKQIPTGLRPTEKYSRMYAIDRAIADEGFFCKSEQVKAECAGAEPSCINVASQLRAEQLSVLSDCRDAGFDAYSCIEGAGQIFRGRGRGGR